MYYRLLLLCISLISFTTIFSQTSKVDKLLFELPDVIFEKIEKDNDSDLVYELKIKQPIDHNNPTKGTFYQRVLLNHANFNHPTILYTLGYSMPEKVKENYSGDKKPLLAKMLKANQIVVEHRYFGESLPDSIDYEYLSLEQVTFDLHRINQLFKKLYPNKWLSTGISKGGATSIFYKYFYPDDVDVAIPFVAPINKEFEDQRIYDFLDRVGSEECRNKIKAFQLRMLKERNQILPLLKFYSLGAKAEYSYLTLEQAFEYTILEYPFSFWQYGHNCSDIPDKDISLEEAIIYLNSIVDITFFSDRDMQQYASHYYQSASEMGYYGYEIDQFKELLFALPTDRNPHAAFVPLNAKAKFDGQLLKSINDWLATEGHHFIYINGSLDTWSATAVPRNPNVDSAWFFLENKHHGNARIESMNEDQKKQFVALLEKWLSVKVLDDAK